MTFKKVDQERRLLRGVVVKIHQDLVEEACRATDHRVAAIFWRLSGRLEGVMRLFGIEREAGTRRNHS